MRVLVGDSFVCLLGGCECLFVWEVLGDDGVFLNRVCDEVDLVGLWCIVGDWFVNYLWYVYWYFVWWVWVWGGDLWILFYWLKWFCDFLLVLLLWMELYLVLRCCLWLNFWNYFLELLIDVVKIICFNVGFDW